jgi:porin
MHRYSMYSGAVHHRNCSTIALECAVKRGSSRGSSGPRGIGTICQGVLGVALLFTAGAACALGPVAVPETWGGSLATRERLTGNWGGVRDDLGRKGVVLDVDMQLTPQVVMSGGRDDGTEIWGSAIYTLNLDTGKAGWWPGGFLNVKAESSFGNAGYADVGAIAPPNLSTLVPNGVHSDTGLESLSFTQFLSTKFGLMLGKIYTLDLLAGEFYGNFHTQFMNTSMSLPIVSAMVPLSAYGGGAVFLPTENISVVAMALDPSGTVMNNDIGDAFDDGVLVMGALSVKVAPYGLVGHQTVTGMWSDKTRLSLTQDPSNVARALLFARFPRLGDPGPILEKIFERYFPGLLVPVQPPNQESETWYVSYGFDQYLWQPAGDPKRGIGVFFNVGGSDGNPNPLDFSVLVGLGGNGVVPGRPRDTFGIGWARTEFSNDFFPFLRTQLNLGLDQEDVVELYYNASITPWLNISPSIQIIDSALERKRGLAGNLESLDTAGVFYLRTYIRF